MAHHKRKKARVNMGSGSQNYLKRSKGDDWRWMQDTPKWWHVLHHSRPHRRATKRLETKIMKGDDPDDIAWPVARKPHIYYW